jgi:hypothetical protein
MRFEKLLIVILISTSFIGISFAGIYDDWPDDSICSWLKQKQTHAGYLAEASKRGLECVGNNTLITFSGKASSSKNTLLKNSSIVVYDVDMSNYNFGEVRTKTDFDFSKYKLASSHKKLSCRFFIKEYMEDLAGLGNWHLAEGSLFIENNKVEIKGYWKTGGLSTNPKYLRDEVNIRLTEDGQLVGMMAFFEYTQQGQAPKSPQYMELKKDAKSKPLDYKKANGARAELWIDVSNWRRGVIELYACKIAS